MLCSDEREVQRQAADLACLTGEEPVVLPGREWQLRPVAAVSRQWECRRLEALAPLRKRRARRRDDGRGARAALYPAAGA